MEQVLQSNIDKEQNLEKSEGYLQVSLMGNKISGIIQFFKSKSRKMKRILSFLLKLKANEERFLRRMLNIFK
jgi:hypothetical protein